MAVMLNEWHHQIAAGSSTGMYAIELRIRCATYSEVESGQLGITSHQTPTAIGIISEVPKKRTRQEEEVEKDLEEGEEENVSPSAAKRTPTPPDLENERQTTLGETPADEKFTTGHDIIGNFSYRSSKMEISSDSEEDDDDDDDDDDDGIIVTIDPPGICTAQTTAAADLRSRCLASSPKFNIEGMLQMYEDLVLYDFK